MSLSNKLMDMKFMKRATENKKRQELQQQSKEISGNSKWKCQDERLDLEFLVEYEESYAAFCTHKPKGILHSNNSNDKEVVDMKGNEPSGKRKLTVPEEDESIDDLFADLERPTLNKSLLKDCESRVNVSDGEMAKRYKVNANKIEWNSQGKRCVHKARDGAK